MTKTENQAEAPKAETRGGCKCNPCTCKTCTC
jgi:hypothetical protein